MSDGLVDWILGHASTRHHLAMSGMHGSLRSVARLLRDPPPASIEEVVAEVAAWQGVEPRRVVLTHGATEGFGLIVNFLSPRIRRRTSRTPTFRARLPEYPPLFDAPRLAGFLWRRGKLPADMYVGSCPANPEGRSLGHEEIQARAEECSERVFDEVFRGFVEAPSLASEGRKGTWVTASLTKLFGADDVRVGWVIPPPGRVIEFEHFAGQMTDGIAPGSAAGAAALLRHRTEVIAESRSLFDRNVRSLRRSVPSIAPLAAPLWFDRGTNGFDGDRVADESLRKDVLVCPGRLFGDSRGVRICLTRRTFPADFKAYLEVRNSFLEG